MIKEKEFGKLSLDQAKRVFALLYGYRSEKHDLDYDKELNEKLKSAVEPWGHFYEVSFIYTLAVFLILCGLDGLISKIAGHEDPQEAFLNLAELDLDDLEIPEDLEENMPVFLSMLMAIIGNIQSLSQFSIPLSLLIERARSGDDDALFKAVYVDRAALQAPTIQKRISQAQVSDDEDFMVQLSKAISRTRPRKRPLPEYDDMRYMLEVIADMDNLKNLTSTQIYNLLAKELQLYGNDEDDRLEAFRKILRKRNKVARK